MSLPRAPYPMPRRDRPASDAAGPEAAMCARLTNARFQRLLRYCAGVLGESVRATEELSQRMYSLRMEIESQTGDEDRCNNWERGS